MNGDIPEPVVRIVSCGDELLCGHTVDTNANWLASRMIELGWRLAGIRTIGDDDADIVNAVDVACRHADAVVFTGGLGPTEDDRTRAAVARALHCGLSERPELVEQIAARFAAFGRPMTPVNRVQAQIPDAAEPLENPAGTAPGFMARLHRAVIYVLPGVPREMKSMFDLHLRARFAAHPARKTVKVRRLLFHGMGESNIGEAIADLMKAGANPTVGTAVAESIVAVRLTARGATTEEADRRIAETEAEIRRRLPESLFGVDDETLSEVVVRELKAAGKTVSVAESCTGGWLAGALVDIPGASDVFKEGVVAYANESKFARLGVPPALVERHGAVSSEVAAAMAAGERERAGTDYALATTGVAGPDGGTPEKPVGLAWIGLADAKGARTLSIRTLSDRAGNRRRAVNSALDWLRRELAGLPPPWQQ